MNSDFIRRAEGANDSGIRDYLLEQQRIAEQEEQLEEMEARLIERERRAFEDDAEALGFDVTRFDGPAADPFDEYEDERTGHRWAGWLAGRASR